MSFRHGPILGDPCWTQGLPHVCIEQALMELAGTRNEDRLVTYHRLARMIGAADAKRLTTPARVAEFADDAGRFVGRLLLNEVLADLRGELSHSGQESRARHLVTAVLAPYGLKLHPRPLEVLHHGRRIGEADLAVEAILLDIEVDGPHHREPVQRDKDQIRDRRMRRAGWEVERFPTELVDLTPKVFQARVDEVVRDRLSRFPTMVSSP
jgi:hypothetical protein